MSQTTPPWPDLLSIGTTAPGDCTGCDERFVNADGDTMTGGLTLAADPEQPLEAATKQYVDAKAAVPGPAGEDGTKWFDGPGSPVEPVAGASPGDYYLDTSTGDVYQLALEG
jgi:hypothetical protein